MATRAPHSEAEATSGLIPSLSPSFSLTHTHIDVESHTPTHTAFPTSMESALIKHIVSRSGRSFACVHVCVNACVCVISCLMSQAQGLSIKSTISELLLPTSNAGSLLCKGRCMCACVCVRADKLTVRAASQGERLKQAVCSCIGTSHWGPRFSASFSVFASLLPHPWGGASCRHRRPPYPHPHTYTYMANISLTERLQMVVSVSKEICCKMKY